MVIYMPAADREDQRQQITERVLAYLAVSGQLTRSKPTGKKHRNGSRQRPRPHSPHDARINTVLTGNRDSATDTADIPRTDTPTAADCNGNVTITACDCIGTESATTAAKTSRRMH